MTHFSFIGSHRGGAGKTTVTANLACLMAQRGLRVATVDTNLQAPGLHCLFGLEVFDGTQSTLNHYLRGEIPLAKATYDVTDRLGLEDANAGRVFVIPASEDLSQVAYFWKHDVDTDQMLEGLVELAADLELDVMLVDTDPGLDYQTFFALERADSLLLVMAPDAQDYRGTATSVEVARRLKIPNVMVMVNKLPPAADAEAITERVQTLCTGATVFTTTASEPLAALASEGIFVVKNPDDPFTQALVELENHIRAIPERSALDRYLMADATAAKGLIASGGLGKATVEHFSDLSRQMGELQTLVQSALEVKAKSTRSASRRSRSKGAS